MVDTRSMAKRREEGNTGSREPAPPAPTGSNSARRSICSSSPSTKARRAQLELEAAEKRTELRKQMIAVDLELVEKKLAAGIAELESTRGSIENDRNEQYQGVEEWLDTSQQEHLEAAASTHHPAVADTTLRPEHRMTAAAERSGTVDNTMHLLASALRDIAASAVPAVSTGSEKHLLNRLSTPKDLPSFGGDPLEWLHYKKAYEESSAVCNYSDTENLWRIRKSLHGRAKEAVMALLIGSTSPKDVISTLQLQFGNPDVIVSRILQDVNRLRPMTSEYHREIISFSVKLKNCVAAVSAIGCEDYLKGIGLVTTILSKLPTVLISKWTDYSYPLINENIKPRLVILSEFLNLEAEKVTRCSVNLQHYNIGIPSNYKFKPQMVLTTSDSSVTKRHQNDKCGFCLKSQHPLPECKGFKKALRIKRWAYVKRNHICFKCLISTHLKDTCSSDACDSCGQEHHRLLHYPKKPYTGHEATVMPSTSETATLSKDTVAHVEEENCKVLLKTVPVLVHGPDGTSPSVALLDDGSTVTLISESLAARVGLRGIKRSVRMRGAWDNSDLICETETIHFNISSNRGASYNITARSVKDLNLPCQKRTLLNLNDYLLKPEIKDLLEGRETKPEILIGQDNYELMLPQEIIKGNAEDPYLTRTPLGWCVHGCVRSLLSPLPPIAVLHLDSTLVNENSEIERTLREIHNEIRQSYAIESVGVSTKPRQNVEDIKAVARLESTSKLINSRWYVGLPWRNENDIMPESYSNALLRLRGVEKKMKVSTGFASRYQERVDHLTSNDYASQIENKETTGRVWYLPHFGVDNPNKQKLRLVFDAAAKSKGASLNDYLLTGPDLLISLYGAMLRFREHRVGITGDIRDMFLRVKIIKEDRDAFRFLWRESPEQPVKTYAMSSLIFGANCSPFVAQFIKNKNAERFATTMPEAVEAIHKQHYMDDYIASFENTESAIKVVNEVSYIHKQGGFEIRNWTCNNQTVLQSLPTEDVRPTTVKFKVEQQYLGERTLGLIWNPIDDTLGFDVSFKKIPADVITSQKRPTKREMLRIVMSIFDVFGFLTPITIKGKIILQDAWRANIGWDEEINEDLHTRWIEWLIELKTLRHVKLPRHYTSNLTIASPVTTTTTEPLPQNDKPGLKESPEGCYKNLQLHIFSDTSTKGMIAVAYWRWFDSDNRIRVAFVASKCRVAPLKYVSVPRLELQAALLGARLAETIKEQQTGMKITQKFMWCDSATVLHWIRNEARSYKVFVAHRLGEIDEYTDISEWRYIPTDLNAADIATRETCTVEMLKNDWLYGPPFLRKEEHLWPTSSDKQMPCVSDVDLEYINEIHIAPECLPSVPDPQRFSSWLRILKTTFFVLTFIEKLKKRTPDTNSTMMERAEVLLLKYSQMKSFPEELHLLKQKTSLNRKSKLLTLTPLLGEDGLLRVAGRIDATSDISHNVKRPVILDGRCLIARLIVKHFHIKACHANQEMVVNELKQHYWIIRLRPTVKYVSSQCMFCRIRKARPQPPRMGDLPEARVAHHQRVFTYTGIDLFGPQSVTVGRRREKRYGVIFTCLTVRAIHLEIVHDLTTDSLIMALRRMAARRGWPRYIYSDNGTNLRGADAELKKCVRELDQVKLKDEIMTYSSATTWVFNPPSSPHWGGAWERLIRNVKNALRVTLKERAPRDETLQTLMTEVEQMVNSRPLSYVAVEPLTSETLTPNHFLLGSSSNLPTLGSFDDSASCLRKQWRISQNLADIFWKRWIREVLPDLLPRKIWNEEVKPLEVGDLVIIVDPNSPRYTWPRGRVERTMAGRDGRVRVAEVRTTSGVLIRSVARLIRLPIP